ncbi:hypothetical protein [Microbulbifer sp.]|uniref:hypothetical protein n=1 Tax=Microbulbifer sp. TaxID=1908541 RepID=UPI002585D07B|nr:hypothetical protein [Microbulbifer sp.]
MARKIKFLSLLILCLVISGCSSQGWMESERRANSLEGQAEQAREQNNYYRAEDLDHQAQKSRENDDFDKANAAVGVVLLVGSWIANLFR